MNKNETKNGAFKHSVFGRILGIGLFLTAILYLYPYLYTFYRNKQKLYDQIRANEPNVRHIPIDQIGEKTIIYLEILNGDTLGVVAVPN